MIVENNTNIPTNINSNLVYQTLPKMSAADGENVINVDNSCNSCTFYNSGKESYHKNTNFKSNKKVSTNTHIILYDMPLKRNS